MNDYTKALHQRFFREPEFPGLQRELEETEQILQEKLQAPKQPRTCVMENLTSSMAGTPPSAS